VIATARAKPFEARRKVEREGVATESPVIFTKVQHRQVENDAHESWICEGPVCTRYSLDAQTFCGAIDAWNSRDYYQAVESLGRK
jgi:hypothetical protein